VEGNVQKDHVHIVLEIPPNQSVSSVVGLLKGKSAIKIFERDKALRKKYRGMHFWSTGYFVSTVGVNEEQVIKYVRWQQKKDQESDGQQNLFEEQ
jgi:putative transposase